MDLPTFKNLINCIRVESEWRKALYDLNVDLMNLEIHYTINNILGGEAFGKDGWDWIQWFVFESKDNGEPQAWDKNKQPICGTVEELWLLVTNQEKL